MKRKHFLLGLFLVFSTCAWAQSLDRKTQKYYTNNPVWIEMMKSPDVNFFEVNAAFELYWAKREKPELENEEEIGGEHKEERSFISKIFKSEKEEQAERNEYAFAYKQYLKWRIEVEPFVQPDGRILSAKEQQEIWEKSR